MNREMLSKAVGCIEERFVLEAYRPAQASDSTRSTVHRRKRRIFTVALAAALLIALSSAAYAAGWFAPIFHSIRYNVPPLEERKPENESYYSDLEDKNAVMDSAEQYMNEQQPAPECVYLPEFDNCEITLLERYYDGKHLELGVRLESDMPNFFAVYECEESIREKAETIAFTGSLEKDDIGALDPIACREILASRSDKAIEYKLHNVSTIVLDSMLCHELSQEEYEAAWSHLVETGHLCIVKNDLYISDHIVMDDGTDLGQTYTLPVYEDMSVRSGNVFIDVPELPETAQGLESLTFHLNVRLVRSFYYMEQDGPTRYYSEFIGEAFVPFRVENAGN